MTESEPTPGRGRPSGEAEGTAGIALREIRESKGLTLEEVATMAGMSKAYLSQIELGKTSPTMRTLERLASALGADLAVVLTSRKGGEPK